MNNSPPHSANDNAPVQLGHYQLRDCIGRGGMGLVYRARDTRLERDVAIKCLRTELFEAHYIERFKREALLLAKLNHPNIVQIYDFIEAPEQVALVMELVDGQNLHLYLREHLVPITQRLQWLVQISEGLAIAHDAGIIHRDLKTENILINKRGQAKITDLGIAKSQDFNATITDHVAGSYCSMSPEQAMGETITFKSDLFSLGILAYQLLCGAHPFGDTNNKLQTMQRIISHPPTAPQKHNPDLPVEFIDLLGQLLSKDPDKRPDNTHWVAAQFAKLKELTWHNDLFGDDTQALAIPLAANTKTVRTQDHPTFDTHFVAAAVAPKNSIWQKIKNYIANNKIIVGSATASFLIIAGVVVWQLQPKPPKYVAVIPPKLTAEGMQESQQELMKNAIYAAIQQSILQLDNYYLIPQNEIRDVNGDNNTVYKATGADELITAEAQCKFEACTIAFARLTPDATDAKSRLRVQNIKTIDVVADRFLSIAEITLTSVGSLYSFTPFNDFSKITDDEYKKFLIVSQQYRNAGANASLLDEIDRLSKDIKKLPALQTLYKDITLDLFYHTNNRELLDRLEALIINNPSYSQLNGLYNKFYMEIAKGNLQDASASIEAITKTDGGDASKHELLAYWMMANNDYEGAITHYKKALESKKTANTLHNIAAAYRYIGKNKLTEKYLKDALELSPYLHQAHSLYGITALQEGNIQQALLSFKVVVSQNPKDIGNLNNYGLTLMLDKNYEEAIKIFQQAAALNPDNTTILLNIADAYNLQGNSAEAEKIYKSIISSTNQKVDNSTNYRNLAQAYAHLHLFSEALTFLGKLEKLDPQNVETSYTSALVHVLANNKVAAIYNIEKSIESGMHIIWFNFSWFDQLCSDIKFINLISAHGAPSRCPMPI